MVGGGGWTHLNPLTHLINPERGHQTAHSPWCAMMWSTHPPGSIPAWNGETEPNQTFRSSSQVTRLNQINSVLLCRERSLMRLSSRESPSLATCDTRHTSGPQMHGVSPHQAILCDPAGCPTTELSSDTVYPEMVSDPAGQGKGSVSQACLPDPVQMPIRNSCYCLASEQQL